MSHRKDMTEKERIALLEGRLDKRDALLGLALLTAFLCLIAAISGGSVAIDARHIAKDTRQVVTETQRLGRQTHLSQIEACHRGNESRVGRIKNYRRDIGNLKSDVRFITSLSTYIPPQSSPESLIGTKKQAITYKRQAVWEELDSIKQYAIKPGSAIVDCQLAYPK